MRLKEYEIVIEPREVVFEHITVNKKFTKTINIKNVGNKSKRMELFRPSNKVFQLKYKNPELPVPPGMEIAAIVEFETKNAQDFYDKMVITIDNKEIDIPIHAFPAKPILVIDEIVDFGTLSAINKTVSRNLKITNKGAVDGEFIINYKGNMPITFVPFRDIVPAFSSSLIRVDYFTKQPCTVDEIIQFMQKGEDSIIEFRVKANILRRELILLDCETNLPIQKIDFGSCYYGCNLTNLAYLYNSSSDRVDYVILLEENGIGAEIGAELSKSTNALKSKEDDYKEDDFSSIGKLVSAFPNNGTLEPFEKRPIFLRFSPQYKNPDSGFLTTLKPPPRRDYAVFLYFEMLGSQDKTELAITGTALPVLLRIEPNKIDFGSCEIGQKKDITAVLYNDSQLKDVKFKFKKVANYTVYPASGRIPPRSSKSVTVSFVPHQMGSFDYMLNCQIIDKLADKRNPLLVREKGIHDVPIELFGNAVALTNVPEPKFNGGIDPKITNEVGLNVNTTIAELKSFYPKAIVQNALNDNLHKVGYAEKMTKDKANGYKIAFPNDRAKSIAPFKRNEKYKTLFTGIDRYNYVDLDYAYTDEEILQIEKHKLIYKKYLDDLKFNRKEISRNKEFYAFNNKTDAGLIPGGGMKTEHLNINELALEQVKKNKFSVNPDWKLISSIELSNQELILKNSSNNKEILNINSLTIKEKEKISTPLTPAQIYKIITSPSAVDFGEVSIKSVSIKNLDFLNTLDQPIHVELEIDCIELSQTSPLGIIIPPQSKGTFPIVFESEYVQTFQRSISYRINNSYRHHIIILAEAKLPSLKLNQNHIVLTQLQGVEPELCYRKNISIINPFNSLIEFTWIPIYGEQGTAFSIRPAAGIIEPFKDLECEIVWHGSYLAPLKGTFSLQVTGGESNTLSCEAKLGSTQLKFITRRANFGKIPVNMVSTKTFYMTNSGNQNAYFQILDTRPIQGMQITPSYGLAPLHGLTPIKIEMCPSEIMKFDAKVMIQIRGGKMLELRLSGESEEPLIDVDRQNFDFGGIFSGASCSLPFKLINKSQVKAKIDFRFKKYPDFSIRSLVKDYKIADHVYQILIQPSESLDLELVFSPTEVSSYDFNLPLFVNQSDSETDYSDNLYSQSPQFSEYNRRTPKQSRLSYVDYSPKRSVVATGLRHAIELSAAKINFNIPIMYLEKLKDGGFYEAKSTILYNHSHRSIKWCLDMRKSNRVLEDGIFKICNGSMIPFVNRDNGKSFGPEGELKPNESYELKILFCPVKPGVYNCSLPIVINNNFDQPYYNIEVTGELLEPEIYFEPEILILKPIPLGMETSDIIKIKQKGYKNKSKLTIEIPQAKTLDGDQVNVLQPSFINEPYIIPDSNNPVELCIKFCSVKPISTTIKLKITDEQKREFFYNVVVTSDNSLFTCYSFLAEHQNDYHIVLEEGTIMKGTRSNHMSSLKSELSGEPILRPFTATSKFSGGNPSPTFDMNASMDNQSPNKYGEEAMQAAFGEMGASRLGSRMEQIIEFNKSQEPILFPPSETTAGMNANQILKILQRWFRCNGWPNSHHIVKIPESFRGGVSRKPLDESEENMPQQDAIKRENKTIYEMIQYLSGRPLPAIPVGAPIPNDLNERTFQFQWQHQVLLKFLEVEGGCVAHIKADHLLDLREFKNWLEQKSKQKEIKESSGFRDTAIETVDQPFVSPELFNLVSKKAWLDCLLQLLKVCVINRITPKSFKMQKVPYNDTASFPDVKTDPLTSNIYNIGERILLTWMNYCYAEYKNKIWLDSDRGGTPPTKWIVNFDIDLTDSLVLAATIGAYCPFIVDSHLKRMYMSADTAEKCFHNALILIESCRIIGLDYDINSLDITDPNSISMALFCAYLFEKLPKYVPGATIEFSSPLHQVVTKQIKISNPSAKNIIYQALIIGPNSDNFKVADSNDLVVPPKGRANLNIEFSANSLKPGNAHLILVAKKQSSVMADTIVFCLKASIDDLTAKKILKFQSLLYKPTETLIEVENPYDEDAEFKITILESDNRNGTIKNPYSLNQSLDESLVMSHNGEKAQNLKNISKSSVESNKSKSSFDKLSKNKDADKKEVELTKTNQPIYSAFYTKSKTIKLAAKSKSEIVVNYLPLQYIKHSAIIIFTNEKLGEFLYYLEGVPNLPDPTRTLVDESALDTTRIKYIKINRNNVDNRHLTFRCYVGDKLEVKLLLPVCNLERENAIVMATEYRMSEMELKRRKVHGVLSSKSLLEALEKLTLNKSATESIKSSINIKNKYNNNDNKEPIVFTVKSRNSQHINVPNKLTIMAEELKSDENLIPLIIKFGADRVGTYSTTIELKSLPDDIRIIPIDFRVTEGAVSEASVAYLTFNSSVFDPITQTIPIKNNSDLACNYQVEIVSKNDDKTVFTGPKKFTIRPRDVFSYELTFLPNAEQKFEADLTFVNLTESVNIRYLLTGIGERRPPLGEIKFETIVGHTTTHELTIPNKSNKKICFYVSSNASFINGPDKIMLLPNKREIYRFDITPKARGEYKGAITFRPGEWPIKDYDSDGEEMSRLYNDEKPQEFTLWYTFDIKVEPQAPESIIELETYVLDSSTLCIPLSNPLPYKMSFNVLIQGSFLEGQDQIEIKENDKYNYELQFKPKRVGKFRGCLIFLNEEVGEFWYDLRLISLDPLPIQLDPVEAQVGKNNVYTIKFTNPLNEKLQFRVIISNTTNFTLERKQHEHFDVEANGTVDVNILFTPSTVGLSDHFTLISVYNEKVGNITYDLKGIGLEPDVQDPISVTCEVGQTQMATISFRNTTDSAIYCDLALLDENNKQINLKASDSDNELEPVFNILLNNLQNLHVSPRGILDIPISFSPDELRKFDVNLVVTARREARMNWAEKDPKRKIDKLKWIYPIKGCSVINAISKANPFVLECLVRKRLEKRMEISLSGIKNKYSSNLINERIGLKLRSTTPQKSTSTASYSSFKFTEDTITPNSVEGVSNEFIHSIQFTGGFDQNELAKNSIAMKLIRVEREKNSGLITLIFDFIFCPSKSFITDAYLQVETSLGGIWRYPLKLVAIEPPPDDTIVIESNRLYRESVVGFRLTSKTDKSLPFKAQLLSGDQVFTVTPSNGELLSEADEGTLFKVGFTPTTYGKTFQTQLIITTPIFQWKYLVKGTTPEYVVPRGMSGIPPPPIRSLNKRQGIKKRNYIVENTYIIQTAASSPIKGASLMSLKYANFT